MFKFLVIFFIDIITPDISSIQIACDVMCVQHVKKLFFSINFFCRAWLLLVKIRAMLMCILRTIS